MAHGTESGSCGHYHVCFDDAAACLRDAGDDDNSRSVIAVARPPAERSPSVHPTACLGEAVTIGRGTILGAYSVVGAGASLGEGCVLSEHAVVRPGTILGSRTRIDSFAVVGGDPQDLSFDPRTNSRVAIGSDVVIREGATIHRSCEADGSTVIENGAYLMANAHVAHDCFVGAGAVLANNVMLAGHVHVGANAVLGGAAGVHQFVRIGEGAMVGGNAAISQDVPPFTMVANRNGLMGLNLVGMRRRGFPEDGIADMKACYRVVYGGDNPSTNASTALASSEHSPMGKKFLEFFAGGRRGFARPSRRRARSDGNEG